MVIKEITACLGQLGRLSLCRFTLFYKCYDLSDVV